MRVGIYAGSFDPVTLGHEWVIEQGCKMFEWLTITIGPHPDKKYTFTEDERYEMLERACAPYKNAVVERLEDRSVLELACDEYQHEGHEVTLLRGCRNWYDFEYERSSTWRMDELAWSVGADIAQAFVIPPPSLGCVSGSMLKAHLSHERYDQARAWVSQPVFDKLYALFPPQKK